MKKKMTIKQLMEKHLSSVVVTNALAKKIHNFKSVWVSDNSSFLTGGLIGVENLYFKSPTVNEFMLDIVKVIPEDIAGDIKNTEVIKPSWKVVPEPMNLTIFYLMHMFSNSDLSTRVKETVVDDLLHIFMLRSLAALHSNDFTYLTDKDIAKTTFENLSNRFLIKKHGSWLKVIRHFVDTTLDSKYQHTILTFEDSEEVKNMISYCQRRVASTFREIYSAFMISLKSGRILSTTSSEVNIGEDTYLKEVIGNPNTNIDAVLRKMIDDSDFLNRDITDVAISFSPSVDRDDFIELLSSFQKDHLSKRVTNIVKTTCVSLHNYLEGNDLYQVKLADTIKSAKGLLISSRSSDKDIASLKKETDKYISSRMKVKSKQSKISLRLSLLLYIFIVFLTI